MNSNEYEQLMVELKKINENLTNVNFRLRKYNVYLLVLTVLAVLGVFLKYYLG